MTDQSIQVVAFNSSDYKTNTPSYSFPNYEQIAEGNEFFNYQQELDSIADEMARRNTNVGFFIGSLMREGFDNLVIPSFKSGYHFIQEIYNWGSGLFSSRNEEGILDQKEAAEFSLGTKESNNKDDQTDDLGSLIRNYVPFNTHYPVPLTANQRACMSFDKGAEWRYNDKIKIFHHESVFFDDITDLKVIQLKDFYIKEAKARLEKSLDHYQNFAQIEYDFVSDHREANVETILFDDNALAGKSFWASAHLPPSIYNERSWNAALSLTTNFLDYYDSIHINNRFDHELGHLILGLYHPFDAFEKAKNLTQVQKDTIKRIGEALDHPEWTVMTYTDKGKVVKFFHHSDLIFDHKLTHEGIGFCESVAAYAKYGSPIINKEKNVYMHLKEDSYLSSVIPATGAQSLHLDASNMSSAVEFVLESSFKPTQFQNGQFFIPPDISTIRATTSMWSDQIYLGPNYNYVDITGGSAKTIIIQPDVGSSFIKGFRPFLDKLIFQGSSFSYEKIIITCHNSSTILEFGEKGKVDLKSQTIGCVTKNELHLQFDAEVKDGVHYLLNLYNKKAQENANNITTVLVTLAFAFVGYKARSKFNRHTSQKEEKDENLLPRPRAWIAI